MKLKPTYYLPSQFKGATKSNYEGIAKRMTLLLSIMTEPMTVAQLAKKTETDVRTIYRDIARLINLGYTIEIEKGHYWIKQ